MALRVGPRGLLALVAAARGDCGFTAADLPGGPSAGWRTSPCGSFPSAMNNQLRTGADKGNPTV